TKLKFGFEVFLPVEFFQFKVNALVVIKAINQGVIVCPQRFGLCTGYRPDVPPLFLKGLELVEVIFHFFRVGKGTQFLQQLQFLVQVFIFLIFLILDVLVSLIADDLDKVIERGIVFITTVVKVIGIATIQNKTVQCLCTLLLTILLHQRFNASQVTIYFLKVSFLGEFLHCSHKLGFGKLRIVYLVMLIVMIIAFVVIGEVCFRMQFGRHAMV